MHAWPERVENACDAHIHKTFTLVCHAHRLSQTLACASKDVGERLTGKYYKDTDYGHDSIVNNKTSNQREREQSKCLPMRTPYTYIHTHKHAHTFTRATHSVHIPEHTFVIAGAQAKRIYIAEVCFNLRVHQRVTVDLRRRREQETRLQAIVQVGQQQARRASSVLEEISCLNLQLVQSKHKPQWHSRNIHKIYIRVGNIYNNWTQQ